MRRTCMSEDRETRNAVAARTANTSAPSAAVRGVGRAIASDGALSARREIEVANRDAPPVPVGRRIGPRPRPVPSLMSSTTLGGARTLRCHDEVRVFRRDRRTADGQSLEPCLVYQARGVIAGRILEDAPAVRLGEGLRAPTPVAGLGHERADDARVPWLESHGGTHDHFVSRERGSAVPEPGLVDTHGARGG